VFEILGITGITLSMLAYVPRVVHLGKEHCSAGISRRAWAMWLVGSLLVGTLAVHRGDYVFIALQFSSLTSAAIVLFLAQKYRGLVCDAHAANPARDLTAMADLLALRSNYPPRRRRRSADDRADLWAESARPVLCARGVAEEGQDHVRVKAVHAKSARD
jgi:lipid-A-disaccharide synthase-like uncharacterized protein